jgi:hypothetical protein
MAARAPPARTGPGIPSDAPARRNPMQVDRRAFLATLGVGSLELMSPEDRAEALEHYMMDELDRALPGTSPREQEMREEAEYHQQQGAQPRGTGRLLLPQTRVLEPMPPRPTLLDFYRLRFSPANHVLQSATHALRTGQPERTVMACLLHDVVLNLIKADHGWWGAQLMEPYVDERISWGIRYHQALRFYPDESVGYEYPELYNRIFGEDYVPEPYIRQAYEHARAHAWYMEARLITVNDLYAFDRDAQVSIDPFVDIIGRNFKQPPEGLGFDNSASAHMWRTIAHADKPL